MSKTKYSLSWAAWPSPIGFYKLQFTSADLADPSWISLDDVFKKCCSLKVSKYNNYEWHSFTFSQHATSILLLADITVGDTPRTWTQWLMFINCSCFKTWDVLIFIMCYNKSLDQIPPFVGICITYSQAIISTKLMKFTVLHTANEVYSVAHS